MLIKICKEEDDFVAPQLNLHNIVNNQYLV